MEQTKQTQQKGDSIPISRHFTLHAIGPADAPGVYAAIAREGGGASSNAGIVDLGDRTLVFDTFVTPQAGADLKAAAEQLTGRPVAYVVNSHSHRDHWSGNQAFAPETAIISTPQTREIIVTQGVDQVRYVKAHPEEVQQAIVALEEQIQALEEEDRDADEQQIAALRDRIQMFHATLETLPDLAPTPPNQTFDRRIVLHGSGRTAELVTHGGGHSPGDALLILPEERVIFLGDLAFFQCHPFMGTSTPENWRAILDQILTTGAETFVPGHGPLGTREDVARQQQYVVALTDLVQQALSAGQSVEETCQQPIPASFDAWTGGLHRFEANVRYLYQYFS